MQGLSKQGRSWGHRVGPREWGEGRRKQSSLDAAWCELEGRAAGYLRTVVPGPASALSGRSLQLGAEGVGVGCAEGKAKAWLKS